MLLRYIIAGIWLLFMLNMGSYAQEKKDAFDKNSMKGMNFLMVSADYLTNSNVISNVENQIKQPSLSPSVAMVTWWGADFMASGDFIANSDDSLIHSTSDLNLSLGYNFQPHKNWTISPSITHSFYSTNTNSFRKMFSTDLHADIDYNYKFINAGITAGYLTGSSHTFYAAFRNSYEVSFKNVIFRESSLVIQPAADVNFGDYEYLNYYYLNQLTQDPHFYVRLLGNSKALRRYVISEMVRHPGQTYQQILDNLLRQKAEDSFKLTSITASLTALYMIGKAGINLGVFINLPVNQPDYIENTTLIHFDLGISYCLDL